MNLHALAPILTSLTMAGVAALSALDRHHERVGDMQTFRFPAILGWVMIVAGLVLASMPFWPGAAGDMGILEFGALLWSFATFAMAAAAYLFRYRVSIDTEGITCGAFFKRHIALSDIRSVKYVRGERSSTLTLRLHHGRAIQFSGLLGDFQSLLDTLHTATPGVEWQ